MAIEEETCYVTPVAMTKDRSEVLQGTLDLMRGFPERQRRSAT